MATTSWYVDYEDGPDSDYMVMTKTTSATSSSSAPSPQSATISLLQRAPTYDTTQFTAIPTQLDCDGTTNVVVVFERDVTSVEVCLVDQLPKQTSHLRPGVTRVNSRTFTFDAPEHREGCVELLVTVDGRHQAIRPRLTYRSTSLRLARGLSTLYVHQLDALCQHVIDLHGVAASSFALGELDRILAASLADSETDVPVHIYEDLFGVYRMQAAPSSGTGDDVNVALTLLHLAAKRGLGTLTERLLDLPDSAEALALCRNRDGRNPSELARQAGYLTLAERLQKMAPIGSTVPQKGSTPVSNGPVPPIMPRSSTMVVNSVQSSGVVARQTVSEYDISSRAKSAFQQCDDVFSADVDDDDVDDEYVDTDNIVRNSVLEKNGSARVAARTVSPADSTTSNSLQRKASYVAATNDDDLLLAAEENSPQPLYPSQPLHPSTGDADDDDQPPPFRPPPPVASAAFIRKQTVDPTTGVATEISPRPRTRTRVHKSRRGQSEDAGGSSIPPPVAPRTAANRYSMVTGNLSGTRTQLTAPASSAPLRNQATAQSGDRGTPSDEFVSELDQIVPVPRGNRPKTNRT